jgi:O-Antigen ligase
VFHIAKASEADGSTSYIGGYNHEAAFSIVLATCFVIACFASGLSIWMRNAVLLALLVGMVLANYRTAILAFAPLAFVYFNLDILGRFPPRQRIILGVGVLMVTGVLALAAAWMLRERFLDLFTTLSNIDALMKPQAEYTQEEHDLLSSRPYIWSGYVYAYLAGETKNYLLGFGPDSWIPVFRVYAHNTLVSMLYEYGLFGVFAISAIWATMLVMALRIKEGPRGKLVAAHLSFFLLNMATMPHWMIEGDLLYGIICGYTLFLALGPAPARVAAKPADPQPRPQLLGTAPEPAPARDWMEGRMLGIVPLRRR